MPTAYIVLRSDTDAEAYVPIGEQEAGNDQAAIKTFLDQVVEGKPRGEGFGEGDYRAVPKRSWPKDENHPKPIRKKISFG